MRFLATLVLLLSLTSVAGAQRLRRDVPPLNDPTPFPKIQAVIDSTWRDGDMRPVRWEFFEGFSPGGSRDLPAAAVARASAFVDDASRGRMIVFIGATDPMRFHEQRRKVNHMFNYTLGLARAAWLHQATGHRGMVATHVVQNDRRGVYVVEVERERGRGADEPVAGVLPTSTNTVGGDIGDFGEIFFTPHVGLTYVVAGDENYVAPQVGLGIRKGNYALWMAYGRTFGGEDEDRIMTSGLRIGPDFGGPFFQLQFVDARKLVTWFDEYTARAVGGTAGIGFGFRPEPIDLTLHAGVGFFNAVTPDELEDEWEIGFHLGASLGFTY